MSEVRDYYVSMRKSDVKPRYALMAGPFSTHEEALGFVDPVRREASRLDPWTDFNYFGTCSMPQRTENKDGWLNVYVGATPRTITHSSQQGNTP